MSKKKQQYFCPKCGLDKGLLFVSKIKGVSPEDRPCRTCRNIAVGEKARGRLPWNLGIPQTEETKQKLKIANLGKTPSNKGTPLAYETRVKISCSVKGVPLESFVDFSEKEQRALYKNLGLSKECFIRDSYTCQKCSKKGVVLNAHHKNSWKHFLNDRYKLSNLITLCEICHKNFHAIYGSGTKIANTADQIDNFIISGE